jgi:Undecaprenyl-phosphate galactose phosphotransferase WbaP
VSAIAERKLSTASILTLPQYGRRSPWIISACILTADLLALCLVSSVTVLGRHLVTPKYQLNAYIEFSPFLLMLLPVFMLQGLYPGLLIHPAEEMRRIFYSVSVVFLVWAGVSFLWRTEGMYSRSVFLVIWALGSPVVLFFRYFTRLILSRRKWWGVPAVVLGSGPAAERVVRKLRDGMLGMKVAAVFSEEEILSWDKDAPPVVGDRESASILSTTHAAQYAIVAMPNKSNLELGKAIQDYCYGFSHVLLVPDMPGVCSLGISARDIGGELGLEVPQRLFHRRAAILKRALDCLLSLLFLLILAPLFVLIACAIKLTSSGPIFFIQSRFCRGGRVFNAVKFRTMVTNADCALADYLHSNPEHLQEWQRDHKLKNDPRMTTVGKWLRRYSLDELPQLINVFLGEMSLVGPRPIVSDEISKYGLGYNLYTRVRPGISGLWQVSGRNNTTYTERVALDEYYVHNWSIWLDMYILLRTVGVVLKAEGAY